MFSHFKELVAGRLDISPHCEVFCGCFEGLLTKVLKQRLYEASAVSIETAVHVDV